MKTIFDYLAAGLAPIPIWDGKKNPRISNWRQYQDRAPTEAEIRNWIKIYNNPQSWAVIAGKVSGNLEVIDFDEKYRKGICKQWFDVLPEAAQELTHTLPLVETRSGGFHIFYRCDEIEGNQKLAMNSDGVMIETRGEGGYVLTVPSDGYTVLRGSLTKIPKISRVQREVLLSWARALNEHVPERNVVDVDPKGGTRPGDVYNDTAEWDEILIPHGWKKLGCRNGECYWQRPGKDDDTVSATTNYKGTGKLYNFSTSVPGLEAEQSYSKFIAYAILNHGGDFKEAARVVSKRLPSAEPMRADVLAVDTGPRKEMQSNVRLKCMDDYEMKPIEWLWEGKIAKGKVTLIAGNPGLGKSQLSLHIAACVSTNSPFPETILPPTHGGSVVILSAEDTPEDVLKPRLIAAGANLRNVHVLEAVRREDDKEHQYDLTRDIGALGEVAQQLQDLALVIIDPISAYMGDTDSHNNTEVRGVLAELTAMAGRMNFAVVGVTHLNKSMTSDSIGRFMGSLAFVAAARAAYIVVKDQYDESKRLFLPAKNNLAEDTGGLTFHVEGTTVGNFINTSRVVFDGIAEMNVNDALQVKKGGKVEMPHEKVIEWLETALKDKPEGVLHSVLKVDAEFEDISQRALSRAAMDMRVERLGSNDNRRWKLPDNYVSTRG